MNSLNLDENAPVPVPAPAAVPALSRRSRDPYPLAEATLSLVTLGAITASIGLAIGTATGAAGATMADFLGRNEIGGVARNGLSISLAIGAAVGGLIGLVYLKLRGRDGVAVLRRAGEVLLPLLLAFLLPSLFSALPWHDKPLTFLVGMTATVLVLERLLLRSFRAWPEAITDYWRQKLTLSAKWSRWLPLGVVLAGSLFYSIYFSYYTILNHHRLNTTAFDLGINVNWCFNALNGHPARSSTLFGPDGGHFLGNHAIFAMMFWLPIYALHPGAEVLLIVQATTAGFGALTLYLFASTQIPRWSAVVVAFGYLFFAPLHGPNFYDFHELIPPLPVHFLLYWAIAREKNWLVAVLVPVLWMFREDVAVGLTVLGVFLALTGIRPRLGLAMALASGVWFVLIKFVIMPHYWQTWFASIYKDLQAPGTSGYGTVVQTILINPAYFLGTMLKEEKLIYFLHFFGPLVLLPCRRWVLMLLAIPGFAFSLLTTGYPPTISIAFQYTCHAIPYVFAATVLMLRVLGQGAEGNFRRRAALGALALGVAAHSYVFGAILQHSTFIGGFSKVEFEMTKKESERYALMERMAAAIPQEASVAGTENEVPHVAARMDAFTLKDFAPASDYILINKDLIRHGNTFANVQKIFAGDTYGVIMHGHGLYLFKKGVTSKDTDAALASLGLSKKSKSKK